MKRYFEIFAALFLGTTMMFSCQQAEEPPMDQGTVPQTPMCIRDSPEAVASTGLNYQGIDYFMRPSMRNLGFNVKFQF